MAKQTHVLTSATFASTAVNSVKSATRSGAHAGETNFVAGDSANVAAVFIDGEYLDISVEASDLAQANTWTQGQTGSLVLVWNVRTNGKGSSSGTKTLTMAAAVYLGCEDTAGIGGEATITHRWRATDPSGSGLGTWS